MAYRILRVAGPPLVLYPPHQLNVHLLVHLLRTFLRRSDHSWKEWTLEVRTIPCLNDGMVSNLPYGGNIVGIRASSNGRCCEEHDVCGSVLKIDSLVWFKSVQVVINGKEQTAIAVYWVTDGVDQCCVGFLPWYTVKHKELYEGKLAQVIEFLEESNFPGNRAKSHRSRGVCHAAVVSYSPTPERSRKQQRLDAADEEDNNEGDNTEGQVATNTTE